MNSTVIAGLLLVVAGLLDLAYGGFSYTRETHHATIGSLELSVKDDRRVDVPLWAGIAAIAVGGILLGVGRRRR